ncbi:putative FBD-associated F-box protein At5g56390 [Pyrus communis]|uniref:putative FBD-associated F-box protein At5g56390 n=1 Tax=Pyrus communis TaxID=23211 RepID=UPI0035C02D86
MNNLEEEKLSSSNRSLSDLHDDILQHILSFSKPREAARTCILSKRWRYVNPIIDLLGFPFYWVRDIQEFSVYVDRAIFLRHFVKSFHYICRPCYKYNTDIGPFIIRWIEGAVLRNVQNLSINIDISISRIKILNAQLLALPCCLFSSISLVQLDLCMPSVLQRPPTVCFSSPKTLKLKYVKFSDEHSTNQLFSSCPVLEDLCLSQCWFLSNVRNVNIRAPKLLRLTIDEDYYGGSDHGFQFMVHGTNLKHYTCFGTCKNEHYLYNQSSLEEADIG